MDLEVEKEEKIKNSIRAAKFYRSEIVAIINDTKRRGYIERFTPNLQKKSQNFVSLKPLTCMNVSGVFAVGSSDGVVTVSDHEEICRFKCFDFPVTSVLVDGRYLHACSADGTYKCMQIKDNRKYTFLFWLLVLFALTFWKMHE